MWSENMQQSYYRTPMPKCDIEITFRHGFFPANFLHIFTAPFPKKNYGQVLLMPLKQSE